MLDHDVCDFSISRGNCGCATWTILTMNVRSLGELAVPRFLNGAILGLYICTYQLTETDLVATMVVAVRH